MPVEEAGTRGASGPDGDRTSRLLSGLDSFVDEASVRSPGLAAEVGRFRTALTTVLASPDEPTPVPGSFHLRDSEHGEPELHLDTEVFQRLSARCAVVDDAEVLSTVVRLLLDASTQLQQVFGGAAAAEELVGLGTGVVPVHESIADGMHPCVGAAAAWIVENATGAGRPDAAVGRITGLLDGFGPEQRESAVRGLTALAEVLLTDETTAGEGKVLIGALVERIRTSS